MKKPLVTRFHGSIITYDPSIGKMLLANDNWSDESISFFWWTQFYLIRLECFFSRKKLSCVLQWNPPIFCTLLSNSFNLYISKLSWVTSSCSTLFWGKIDGILHPSSTTVISSEHSYLTSYLLLAFSDETSSSATVLILLSNCVSINFFFGTPFTLFFFRLLFLSALEPWIVSSFFQDSDFLNFLDPVNAAHHE